MDIFVAGVGTGGTISGVGRYLKEQNPDVKIVAVEPASSPLLTQGHAGPHGLQGIGANFVPDNLDRGILDEILTVTDQDAYETGRALARREGILVGITSGAAVWAAAELARRPGKSGQDHRGAAAGQRRALPLYPDVSGVKKRRRFAAPLFPKQVTSSDPFLPRTRDSRSDGTPRRPLRCDRPSAPAPGWDDPPKTP